MDGRPRVSVADRAGLRPGHHRAGARGAPWSAVVQPRRRPRTIGVPPPRRRHVRLGVVGATLVAGLLAGSTIGLLAEGGGEAPSPVQHPLEPTASLSPPPEVQPIEADTLLAWTPGGLPPGLGRAVGQFGAVDHVVSVVSGTAWLSSSISADGARVDVPPPGMAIPLEVGAAAPSAYAPFLTPSDRALLPALERGEAVLGASEAELRHIGIGGAPASRAARRPAGGGAQARAAR